MKEEIVLVPKTLKQSSKITNAPAYPSLIHEKTSKCLMHWAFKNGKMSPGEIYEMPLNQLRELLNYNDDKEIKKVLALLAGFKIDWEAFHKFNPHSTLVWGSSSLFADCALTSNSIIRYSFSPIMVQELFKPHSYRIFDFEVLMSFKSVYAFKIYQVCGQFYNAKSNICRTKSYTLDELRLLFNVEEGKYSKRYDFIQKVIVQPLVCVNEISHFSIFFKDDGATPSNRRYWWEMKSKEKKIKSENPHLLGVDSVSERKKIAILNEEKEMKSVFLRFSKSERRKIRKKCLSDSPILQLLSPTSKKKQIAALNLLEDEDFPIHYLREFLKDYLSPPL